MSTEQIPPPDMPPSIPNAVKEKRVLAGIMGILLGALGIHKFILGYRNTGIIQCVIGVACIFTTCFVIIPCLIGAVEGVIYLTKTDEEFDEIYIKNQRKWF